MFTRKYSVTFMLQNKKKFKLFKKNGCNFRKKYYINSIS